MYLHIGGNSAILIEEIIAILDRKTIQSRSCHQDWLVAVRKAENMAGTEKINSIVLTKEGIFFSSISSLTLKKRMEENITG